MYMNVGAPYIREKMTHARKSAFLGIRWNEIRQNMRAPTHGDGFQNPRQHACIAHPRLPDKNIEIRISSDVQKCAAKRISRTWIRT